jgi:hypothetical protein
MSPETSPRLQNSPSTIISDIPIELGHLEVHPLRDEYLTSLSTGYLLSLLVNSTLAVSPSSRLVFGIGISLFKSVDAYVDHRAKAARYEHEYAREVWEHELNPDGEVDEYVNYATGKGVPENDARVIGRSISAHPTVSVPYHLAFELGLAEPVSYRQHFNYALMILSGLLSGYGCNEGLTVLLDRFGWQDLGGITLPSIGLIPLAYFRFRNVLNLPKRTKFIRTVAGSVSSIILLISVWVKFSN